MKVIHLVLAMSWLILASCYSVHSIERYGVEATLIQGEPAVPIAKAPVTITIDDQTFVRKSNRHGDIRVRPDKEHHITWLGGPAIMSDTEANITINCEGFEPIHVDWFRYSPIQNASVHENRGVIHLGELKLNPIH